MAFDFPNSPATGTVQTGPNGAQWQWDGVKWVANNTGGVISDAPANNLIFGRQNNAWTSVTPSLQAAQDSSGRNLVTNGTFVVQQRSTGPWTTGYTMDRWLIALANDTVSFSAVTLADADRAAIGDEAAAAALQNVFTGSATANSNNQIGQRIEKVRRLSGKTVTVSFWAKAASGTPQIGINILQSFGTGGSPSTAGWALTTGNSVTISTTWTRYNTTIAVPSTSGKVLGTNGDDYSQLSFFFSASGLAIAGIGQQSGTVQVYGVQLEIGSVATPLDAGGSPQQILSSCQRFYTLFPSLLLTGYSGTGLHVYNDIVLPVTMRAAPSVAFGSINYNNTSALVVNAANTTDVRFDMVITATGYGYTNVPVMLSADL